MKRKNNFIIRNVGSIKLLVPISTEIINLNGFVVMNDMAVFLWELLKEKCLLNDLIDEVVANFDIDYSTARNDVQLFINEIKNLELLA
ncbi:MAG: PqqD family protein [Chlorobium sp.]|nr:PqqD family protein [Chlorobium sp.]